MYPLKLKSVLKEKIWGGRKLESLNKDLPDGDIGESWEVACHRNGKSVVVNGKYKGMNLCELLSENSKEILGDGYYDRFPLLVKFIHASKELSVQVHPDDDYSLKHEGDLGKTEAWYILDASEDAKLILGNKGCSVQEIVSTSKQGKMEECLNYINVKAGDFFYVPSGMVHGIGGDILLIEIQENSDTTYRIFDYDRGRELHVEKAEDVVKRNLVGKKKVATIKKINKDVLVERFVRSRYFTIDKITLRGEIESSTSGSFEIYTCISGSGLIKYGQEEIGILKGETVIIPASLGTYSLKGQMELVKSFIEEFSSSDIAV
ncbi:MAG: class I mannose-6-phosphate isomerase [Firmicutes bacterium]|jgi:mannose-6-phosphate isomerase|nr:class I mannose-6-phosphate isomerase [Bacillota bacterium]